VPLPAVKVEPSCAEPVIVGGAEFVGLAALAARPSRAVPKTAPIASAEIATSIAVGQRRPRMIPFISSLLVQVGGVPDAGLERAPTEIRPSNVESVIEMSTRR
jgi:hypothetical protein